MAAAPATQSLKVKIEHLFKSKKQQEQEKHDSAQLTPAEIALLYPPQIPVGVYLPMNMIVNHVTGDPRIDQYFNGEQIKVDLKLTLIYKLYTRSAFIGRQY